MIFFGVSMGLYLNVKFHLGTNMLKHGDSKDIIP